MSPLPLNAEQVLQHFTHIHPLTKVDGVGTYICDGCKTYGSGRTYRCAACNYDLHEFCAICPPTLLSTLHPHHELRLVHQDRRACDICKESINGLFYQCKTCGFDVHPLCTQLPKEVIHNHGYTKQVQVRESHMGSTSKTVRVMVLGAGVAWLCMTGDVSGVVSAFL